MWKIPLFDTYFSEEETEAVRAVLKSGWLTMGEVTEKFEKRFAEFVGVKHAVALSSCTAALHLAHLALGIKKNDEVICPALTFVAGANAILYTGAKPVFAEITSPADFNISPGDIKRKITKRTRAIQVLHYAGFPCDMASILEIADRHNIAVIEDCAHAIGSLYRKKRCGALGDIGCFSFFSNKNMTTGEGGMVTTNDDEFAKNIRLMRSHGMTTVTLDRHLGHAFDYDVTELGFNYRIDELRAAIGIVQLEKLRANNKRREKLVPLYRARLKDVKGIEIPFAHSSNTSTHHIFPILLRKGSSRSKFMEHMKRRGIQTSIHYPAIHLFDLYRRQFNYKDRMLPMTEDVAKREVTLPLYPAMRDGDIGFVCDAVIEFFEKERKG